jgi:hypothetical protein
MSKLLTLAVEAVIKARPHVRAEARVSHVGFRSSNPEEWRERLEIARALGTLHMTYKPDGREIPFIKLANPLVIEADSLYYLELPAPKPIKVLEPEIVVAFQHAEGSGQALLVAGYDIREQMMHAEDYIARDRNEG